MEWEQSKYKWLSKPANLVTNSTSAMVITDAQVYFVNINNTTDNLIYSSAMKSNIRDHYWCNYNTNAFTTLIQSSFGGVLINQVDNRDNIVGNPCAIVGDLLKRLVIIFK
tara:strand:+ start:2061 stop:2390 length:330 start_codon:yes stop_codon:yes gene_type:complete